MASRVRAVLGTAALFSIVFQAPSLGKSITDNRMKYVDPVTNQIRAYQFKGKRLPVAWGDAPDVLEPTTASPVRTSLGEPPAVGSSASPGFTVDVSYNDDQYIAPAGHMVEWRKYPLIRFAYSNVNSPSDYSRYGCNVYDPVTANWPYGAELGQEVQAGGDVGGQVDMTLNPSGFVVLGGVDGASAAVWDNHFYMQTRRLTGTWGTGTRIAASQYNVNFLTTSNLLHNPRIESQAWATDTFTHIVAIESQASPLAPNYYRNTLQYFRKVGSGQAGTWTGPVTIDTISAGPLTQRLITASIVASRISPKVAIVWLRPTPDGLANSQPYDNDVWYKESDSVGGGGFLNAPKMNVTSYGRTVSSYTANPGAYALYDSQGLLHILFSASPVDAEPYSPESTFFWGDYSCSLFHWSKRVPGPYAGGSISIVHSAEWGIDVNSEVCGFGDPGTGYIGFYSLAECDSRLYAVFTQYLDFFGGRIDDCAVGATDRRYAANGEIYVSVANDLDGMLWDAARNLTNTYTPNCDSAGGAGGECANDTRPTVSRYGMNVNTFDTGGIPVSLVWPGTELKVPAGGTADSMFLHVFYTADKFPAPGWRDPTTYNRATPNPLKWMRMACVDPVSAPQIRVSPNLIAYPEFTKHGMPRSYTITVTNEGNQDLHITTISTRRTSPITPYWLSTSTSSLTVPAGQSNTSTFNVTLNAGGLINNPGSVVSLNGEVYLKSDAPAPRDSVSIFIENFLVADTVVGLDFDTLITCGVKLMVDNHGNMGSQGQGRVNLDFVGLGECDTIGADVYLYDGGPIVIRYLGAGSYVYSNALFQGNFSTDQSFKPLSGGLPGSFVGTGYDGYFTGTFVTRDTAVGMKLRYYGPTGGGDSCDFIIQQMKVFKMTPGTLTGVTVGQAIDWDIWSDLMSNKPDNSEAWSNPDYSAPLNRSGVSTKGNFVYLRGVDTGAVTGCNPDSGRFATQAVLGMYRRSDSIADGCTNDVSFYGMYPQYNDSLFKHDTLPENLEASWYWNEMGIAGCRSRTGTRDFHTITTYQYNTTLSSTDTLTIWTVLTSLRYGTLSDLEANVSAAEKWYYNHIRDGCPYMDFQCGNIDCDPVGIVDISDISAFIDHLFINFTPFQCPEANADLDDHLGITIMDLAKLIDNQFITFEPLNCPPTQDPLGPPASATNFVSYSPSTIPAGDTSATLQIYLTNDVPVDAMVLPMEILVDGAVPLVDPATVYYSSTFVQGVLRQAGTGQVMVVKGPDYCSDCNIITPGFRLVASIPIRIAASPSARSISVTYKNFHDHYRMLVTPSPDREAYTPSGPFVQGCTSGGCGDFNGDLVTTSTDVSAGSTYLLRCGAAPVSFTAADADDHLYYTLHDLARVQDFVSSCAAVSCPPSGPAIRPQPSEANYIRYVQCYSSPLPSADLDIFLNSAGDVDWLLLPLKVSVIEYIDESQTDTLIPTIDSITTYLGVNDSIIDPGNALLRLHKINGSVLSAGEHKIATLHLSSPTSSNPKRVRLVFEDLPPTQSGKKVNYPQLIGPPPERSISVPMTICDETGLATDPCCCVGTTGNIDCDAFESVDIADLTMLIDYLFISFTPLCCPGEANINTDPSCSDIGDLSALIDYLFVSFQPLRTCR